MAFALCDVLKLQQTGYFDIFVEDVACVGKFRLQFYDEVAIDLFGMEFLDEVASSLHGATRRQEIVVQNTIIDCICINATIQRQDEIEKIWAENRKVIECLRI